MKKSRFTKYQTVRLLRRNDNKEATVESLCREVGSYWVEQMARDIDQAIEDEKE